MSTVTNSSSWYHLTPASGSAATSWAQGGPRKGLEGGQNMIGLVAFSKTEIASAINGGRLLAAELVLNRESGYGTGAVSLSLAPVRTVQTIGSMTHEQCVDMAERRLHHLTAASGAQTRIPLPGYWLKMMAGGELEGILIYQEEGEGDNAPMRFTAAARLELTTGTSYQQPVWMRPVGRGDLISGKLSSHIGDLAEIIYYLDLRRAAQSLSAVSLDDLELGPYRDWAPVIRLLQSKTTEVIEAEHGTVPTFTAVTDGQMPSALAVNELRLAMENVGQKESMAVTQYARSLFTAPNAPGAVDLYSAGRWTADPPRAGTYWEYEWSGDERVQTWFKCFGYWLLSDLMAGKTVNTAKLRVKRARGAGGSQQIILCGSIYNGIPSTTKMLDQVLDQNIVCGTGQGAIGETVDVELTAEAIRRLKLGAGEEGKLFGVGVKCTDPISYFDATATLIINDD